MAKQSRAKLVEQWRMRQWLRWELLRRSNVYQGAFRDFFSATNNIALRWEARRPIHPDLPVSIESENFGAYYARFRECVGHITACRQIEETHQWLVRRLGADLASTERQALGAGHGSTYEALQREVLLRVQRCLSSDLGEGAPLLKTFQVRWGVRFPLDPMLPAVVWELVLPFPEAPAVTVRLLSWTPEAATVEVRLDASRPRLHAELDMHLDALAQLPSTQRLTRRVQERKYYEELLKVYDLFEQGLSAPEIAKALWPQEEVGDRQRHGNIPSNFGSVQKAYNYRNAVNALLQSLHK